MKKEEYIKLEEVLKNQLSIVVACNDLYSDIKYMQSGGENEAEKDLLQEYQMSFILFLMWNRLVLELCKLFSESSSDKHRFRGVLNTILNKHKNSPFAIKVNKASILALIELMESEVYLKHLGILTTVRDKYVAHLDYNTSGIRIGKDDIEYLLGIADRVKNEIIEPIVEGVAFSKPSTLKDFIKNIAKYKFVFDKIESAVSDRKIAASTEQDLRRILNKKNFIAEGLG